MTIKEFDDFFLRIRVLYYYPELDKEEWKKAFLDSDYDIVDISFTYMLITESTPSIRILDYIIKKLFILDIVTKQDVKDYVWQEKGFKDEQDFIEKLKNIKIDIEEETIC